MPAELKLYFVCLCFFIETSDTFGKQSALHWAYICFLLIPIKTSPFKTRWKYNGYNATAFNFVLLQKWKLCCHRHFLKENYS